MPEKFSVSTKRLSRFQRLTRIAGVFVILLAIAGLGGYSSNNFTTFLFFEAIALILLDFGIKELFFGQEYTGTSRINFNTEYLRKRVGGLRPSNESEQTGLEEYELERVKRAPEILADIMVASLLALITSLILMRIL